MNLVVATFNRPCQTKCVMCSGILVVVLLQWGCNCEVICI